MSNLNDLEREYLELEKENFQDGKRIKFIANLGASDEIAYHYELICKQWQEGRQYTLTRVINHMTQCDEIRVSN